MDWRDQLVKMALLGTERRTSPLPTPPGELVRPFAQLAALDREPALLGALGIAAVYRLAGRLPEADSSPGADPCPPDDRPICSTGAAILLARILAGEHIQLLPEFLDSLNSAGKRVPEQLLPALLEHGRNHPNIRSEAEKVIGKRGRWLAEANSGAWGWAIAAEEREHDKGLWQTGTRNERLTLLRHLRVSSPARAIELLESTWKDETAEDRAVFVATMETGLSPSDEAFLEAALDDRRKEVRTAAAQLLMRLSGSALVRRMEARLKLRWQEGPPCKLLQLKRAVRSQVEMELPAECDKSMQRDGIEPKPRSGIGERAWWLEQMLGAVPPSLWSRDLGKTTGDLIEAGLASDWSRALLNGWVKAALRHPDSSWAEALLGYWTNERSDDRRIELYSIGILQLLGQLEQPAAESFVAGLSKGDRVTRSLFWLCLPYLGRTWSLPFSKLVVDQLRSTLVSSLTEAPAGLTEAIRYASLAVAPQIAPDIVRTDWQIPTQMWGVPAAIDNLITVAQFRRDMLKELGL